MSTKEAALPAWLWWARALAVLTCLAGAGSALAEVVEERRSQENSLEDIGALPDAGTDAAVEESIPRIVDEPAAGWERDAGVDDGGATAAATPDATAAGAGTDESGDDDASLDTPRPTEWVPAKGRQCHRYRGRWVCEGPKRIPVPHGEAAERAKRLGLGTRRAAVQAQTGPPRPEWLEELGGEPDETYYWPVDDGRLWRHFGPVVHRGRRRYHKGIDIGARRGNRLRAVSRGLVVYSNNTINGYGNLMLIVQADELTAFYAHCNANYVFAGQIVRRGQVIGEVGNTGLAYGAHLHFELRRGGRAINPLPLLKQASGRRLPGRRD